MYVVCRVMCVIIDVHTYTLSIFHGVGYFQFKNRTQGFELQHSSQDYSIKCFISVHRHDLPNDILDTMLLQRQELRDHLEEYIKKAHALHISCAKLPVGYLECPLHAPEEKCTPHIRLDRLTCFGDVICTKSFDYKVVPPESYVLLFVTSMNSSEFNANALSNYIININNCCCKVSIAIQNYFEYAFIISFKFYTL